MITIIYGYNTIDTFRQMLQEVIDANIPNNSILAIDNHSTDGTYEWLSTVNDIDVIYFDDCRHSLASMFYELCTAYELDDDVMVLDAGHMPAQGAIASLYQAHIEHPDMGIIGGAISDTPEADGIIRNSLYLPISAYIISQDVWNEPIGYDDTLITDTWTNLDYSLQAITLGYKIGIAGTAIFGQKREDYDPYGPEAASDLEYLRDKWGMHYFNREPNRNIVGMIDSSYDEPIKVLEVGCACGATLIEIGNRYPDAELHGLELNERAVQFASCYCNVAVADIEDETSIIYSPGYFDYIIFGDVLEHLRDPEHVLNYMHKYLKSDGRIIVSVPNLMNINVIKGLLNGDFTYTDTGLLDRTHIHMFTYNELMKMLSRSGYEMQKVDGIVNTEYLDDTFVNNLRQLVPNTPKYQFDTFQYLVRASQISEYKLLNNSIDEALNHRICTLASDNYRGIYLWKYLEEMFTITSTQTVGRNATIAENDVRYIPAFASDEAIAGLNESIDSMESRDYLFALSSIRRMYNGRYEHTVMDAYISSLDENSYYVLEPEVNCDVDSDVIVTRNRVLFNREAVVTKYGLDEVDENEISDYVVEHYVNPAQEMYDAQLPEGLVLNAIYESIKIVKEHRAYVEYFTDILRQVHPRAVIYSHGSLEWICYLKEAAENLGIITIEVAHGAFARTVVHPRTLQLSDYYFCQGSVLEREMREAGLDNVYAVGKPSINDIEWTPAEGVTTVSFVSSLERDFFEKAVSVASVLNRDSYRLIYKAHITENLSDADRSLAANAGLLIVPGTMDVRELYTITDVMVGKKSTAIVDAMPYTNMKIVTVLEETAPLLNTSVQFYRELAMAGDIISVNSLGELIREIRSYRRGIEYRSRVNSYWPENSDNCFRQTLERLTYNNK